MVVVILLAGFLMCVASIAFFQLYLKFFFCDVKSVEHVETALATNGRLNHLDTSPRVMFPVAPPNLQLCGTWRRRNVGFIWGSRARRNEKRKQEHGHEQQTVIIISSMALSTKGF